MNIEELLVKNKQLEDEITVLHLFSFQTPIFINIVFYKNYLKMYYYIVLVKWNTKTK